MGQIPACPPARPLLPALAPLLLCWSLALGRKQGMSGQPRQLLLHPAVFFPTDLEGSPTKRHLQFLQCAMQVVPNRHCVHREKQRCVLRYPFPLLKSEAIPPVHPGDICVQQCLPFCFERFPKSRNLDWLLRRKRTNWIFPRQSKKGKRTCKIDKVQKIEAIFLQNC